MEKDKISEKELRKILEKLSPNERKVLKYITEKNIKTIEEKAKLDATSTLRALKFLSNKELVKLQEKRIKIIGLGINGLVYKKKDLPERKLLNVISEKSLNLGEAKKESKLNDNEFKAALGALKKKALIEIKNKRILLNATKEEVTRKTFEEKLIEELPLKLDNLRPEQLHAFKNLEKRKDVVFIWEKREIKIQITELGRSLISSDLALADRLLEKLTSNIIKKNSWKGKKFRRFDILSPVPQVYGGRKHALIFVIDKIRRVFLEMGFKEMTGPWVETAFWDMDSMFIPQDHPAREIQDTFYLPYKGEIDKKLAKKISEIHENGGSTGSKGYGYKWDPEIAKQLLLRTHTTAVTYRTFSKGIKIPCKYFCVGRIFRNEALDSTHLPEFHQVEGFIADKDLNLRDLMGYIKEFYKRMGIEKIKFRPVYNPYTEPSMEAVGYSEETGQWLELINSGIFRPEALEPYGIKVPVIAWGLGVERLAMFLLKKGNIRELIGSCNLDWLRKYKVPKFIID